MPPLADDQATILLILAFSYVTDKLYHTFPILATLMFFTTQKGSRLLSGSSCPAGPAASSLYVCIGEEMILQHRAQRMIDGKMQFLDVGCHHRRHCKTYVTDFL